MTHIEIIHGTDTLLVEEKVTNILKLIPKEFREFCYLKYFGQEAIDEDILNEVSTLPFGCQNKLVVLKEYQDIKNKNLVDRLVKECDDSCFLILTSMQLKMPSVKLNKTINQNKNKVKFSFIRNLKVPNLENRISNYLRKHNFKFEKNAVNYVANQLKDQPEFLKGELEKIHLFLLNNKGQELNLKNAQHLLSIQDEDNVFEITNHILKKDKSKAFKSLTLYLKNAENFILLQVILQKEILKLMGYIEMKALNINEADIFSKLKTPNWGNIQQNIKEMARQTSISQIQSLFMSTCELERVLKSESITSENRDKKKVNLLGRHLLLKMISVYCQ